MKPRRITVISIDGLGADWLGPYGNSLVSLPALDRFAAESLTCEFHYASSFDLTETFSRWWTPPAATAAACLVNLPAAALAAGYRSILVTDDETLTHHPAAQGFDEHVLCRSPAARRAAREAEGTSIAHTLAEATALLSDDEPMFAWIHTGGFYTPWDAPYEYRARFAGEEETPPGDFLEPPNRTLGEREEEAVLEAIHAYAGQLASLDSSLARLFAAAQGDDSLTIFTAPRGYPLGEHGALGAAGLALRGPTLHVPLLIRFPHGERRLNRFAGLSSTSDLFATLAAALELGEFSDDLAARSDCLLPRGELLNARVANELSIRTRAWFYRCANDRAELYVKPADRWEANDIASRCAPIVEEFRRLATGGEISQEYADALEEGWN